MEAKILFDADKLDVTGVMGIARTLAYKGIVAEPLYYVEVEGQDEEKPSFFHEYNWKLKHVYDKFHTERAKAIAKERQRAGISFYESMYNEVCSLHKTGLQLLNKELE